MFSDNREFTKNGAVHVFEKKTKKNCFPLCGNQSSRGKVHDVPTTGPQPTKYSLSPPQKKQKYKEDPKKPASQVKSVQKFEAKKLFAKP